MPSPSYKHQRLPFVPNCYSPKFSPDRLKDQGLYSEQTYTLILYIYIKKKWFHFQIISPMVSPGYIWINKIIGKY